MKLLNLSALTTQTNRKVKVGEKMYEIKVLKVRDFIRITEAAEELMKLAKEGEPTVVKEMKLTVELIKSAIPEVTDEQLDELSIEQLRAISEFIRGADDIEGVETSVETKEASAEQEGK